MPTYAKYAADDTRTARRAAQDSVLRERHAAFDLQAQDRPAKFERFRFAVVGEGSRDANDNYRRGYDAVDWSRA